MGPGIVTTQTMRQNARTQEPIPERNRRTPSGRCALRHESGLSILVAATARMRPSSGGTNPPPTTGRVTSRPSCCGRYCSSRRVRFPSSGTDGLEPFRRMSRCDRRRDQAIERSGRSPPRRRRAPRKESAVPDVALEAGDDSPNLGGIRNDAARRRRALRPFLSSNARRAYDSDDRHSESALRKGHDVQLVNLGQQPCPGLAAAEFVDLPVLRGIGRRWVSDGFPTVPAGRSSRAQSRAA